MMGRRYDQRVRNAIVRSGNSNPFPELDIPKSTVRDWFRKGLADVVTTEALDASVEDLIFENQELKASLDQGQAAQMLVTEATAILDI